MRWARGVFALALLHWPLSAHADALECISAHADGQVLRKAGKFQAARQKFASCASDACPALVKKDCASFAAELEAAQPSLIVTAKSAAGSELAIATITVDDAPQSGPERLLLDGGEHRVSVTLSDGRQQSATVTLREAERTNLILTFKDAASDAGRTSLVPAASYVLGAVGVAALGSFAYFGLRGRAKENSFDECSKTHSCPVPDVREMRHLYLAADLSLGASLISLGLGTYFLVDHLRDHAEPRQALRLHVVATPGGYLLSAAGHF